MLDAVDDGLELETSQVLSWVARGVATRAVPKDRRWVIEPMSWLAGGSCGCGCGAQARPQASAAHRWVDNGFWERREHQRVAPRRADDAIARAPLKVMAKPVDV